MNFSSSYHRVDAFYPQLVIEATLTATVPFDELLAMPQERAIRALFTIGGPSVPITETLTGEFQTVTPLRPANATRIVERLYRIKRRAAARL